MFALPQPQLLPMPFHIPMPLQSRLVPMVIIWHPMLVFRLTPQVLPYLLTVPMDLWLLQSSLAPSACLDILLSQTQLDQPQPLLVSPLPLQTALSPIVQAVQIFIVVILVTLHSFWLTLERLRPVLIHASADLRTVGLELPPLALFVSQDITSMLEPVLLDQSQCSEDS